MQIIVDVLAWFGVIFAILSIFFNLVKSNRFITTLYAMGTALSFEAATLITGGQNLILNLAFGSWVVATACYLRR